MNMDEEKYKNIREFHKHIGEIQKRIQVDINKEHEDDYGCGIILYLLYKTGIRHGEKRGGDTTGCCSLKVRHVTLSPPLEPPYFVTLKFFGKDNIPYTGTIAIEVQHHKVIKKLMQKKDKDEFIDKSQNEDIFTIKSERNVETFLKDLNFTMKNFRTYLACISLERNIWAIKSNNEWEAITKFYEYINIVGAIMNHKETEKSGTLLIYVTNPTSTLKDYIDPAIIHSFCKRKGISINDIYTPALRERFVYADDTSADSKVFSDGYNDEDYSFEVSKNQNGPNNSAEEKQKNFEEFDKKIGDIRKRIKDDLKSKKIFEMERGIILFLLDKTGINAFGKTNEGTSSKCLLKVCDINIIEGEPSFVTLHSIGQNKIEITEDIKDIKLTISKLKEKKKDGEDLFTKITEENVNKYLETLSSLFTLKTFQTYFAEKLMNDDLKKVITKFNKILNTAATIMDNRKTVTINGLEIYVPNTDSILRDYIDPAFIRLFGERESILVSGENERNILEGGNEGIQTQSNSQSKITNPIKEESKVNTGKKGKKGRSTKKVD